MSNDEKDEEKSSGEIELANAEEYVIKQRCEDILEARRNALQILSNLRSLLNQTTNPAEERDVRAQAASQVWRYAYECKQLLIQTEAGTSVWEGAEIGRWQLDPPQVSGEVESVIEYRIVGVGAVTDGPPTIDLIGVEHYVDISPPVTVQSRVETLPANRRAPTPTEETVSYQQSPPRGLLVNVFDAVDDVVSEVGLAPEVKPADDEAEYEYEDLL